MTLTSPSSMALRDHSQKSMNVKGNGKVTFPPMPCPPSFCPLKASSSRPLKQPVTPWQFHMTMNERTQIMVNNAFPLGRESPHATQHCNTWSQSFCGILSINMKWRRIGEVHLTRIFSPTQMSAKRGLHQFRQKGADTLMKELQQLIDQWVMHPCDANILSQGEKKSTLKYLMVLKEKQCRKVKGRGCADGRKQ